MNGHPAPIDWECPPETVLKPRPNAEMNKQLPIRTDPCVPSGVVQSDGKMPGAVQLAWAFLVERERREIDQEAVLDDRRDYRECALRLYFKRVAAKPDVGEAHMFERELGRAEGRVKTLLRIERGERQVMNFGIAPGVLDST
jgi:hypothetical protein